MVKKINEDAIAIKRLIAIGELKQSEIAALLGINRQKVYYWAHTEIKFEKKKKKKIKQILL